MVLGVSLERGGGAGAAAVAATAIAAATALHRPAQQPVIICLLYTHFLKKSISKINIILVGNRGGGGNASSVRVEPTHHR